MNRLLYILSMMIFGTLGLFVRHISVSSSELALYRAILATILIVIFLLLTKNPIDFKHIKKDIPYLIVSGIAMGLNWIFLFEAYKYTTVSVATLCYYFAPIIVTVVSPILFHETLTKKQMICFMMATIGIILITGLTHIDSHQLLGIVFGLLAACFYASVVLMNKFMKQVDGIHRTLLQFLFAIMILLPYVLLNSHISLFELDKIGWMNLLIVGLLHTGITYCIYFSTLKELPGQEAAILSYIDPLVAVIVSVLLLQESISITQIIGGILILGFTLLNELKR